MVMIANETLTTHATIQRMIENITVSGATVWKRRRPLMPNACSTENLKTFFHTITGLYFSSSFGLSVLAAIL